MPESRPTQELRIYVDGSSQETMRRAGVGVVVVDQDGTVCGETAKAIPFCDSLEAELRAILAGLEFAASLGIVEFRLLSDCKHAVDAIRGNSYYAGVRSGTISSRCAKLRDRVREKLSCRPMVKLEFVPREANVLSDRLATSAARQARRGDRWQPPSWHWESRPGVR